GWLDAPKYPAEGGLSLMQGWWLTQSGVLGRAALYFVIWIGLALLFNSLSAQQDINKEDRKLRARIKFFAGPGIILYVFAMSFAAVDWRMLVSSRWASTISGLLFVVGDCISGMQSLVVLTVLFVF